MRMRCAYMHTGLQGVRASVESHLKTVHRGPVRAGLFQSMGMLCPN